VSRAPRSIQKAVQQTDQAAAQLLDWLRQQRKVISGERVDAAEPDAPLVVDHTASGEPALSSISDEFDEQDQNKAQPTVSGSAKDTLVGLQETGGVLQSSASVSIPEDLSRSVEALGQSPLTLATKQLPPGEPELGVKGMTIPLQAQGCAGRALRLPHTDWLHHHLDVTGPAGVLADFQVAAAGAGTIPWPFDRNRLAEDLFHLLVAPPAPQRRRLSLAGARVLARQLCDAAERRHEAAVARVGHSRICPFDLHALVPVPSDILSRGPDHPDSLAWLWAQWGTTEALRRVVLEPALVLRNPLPAGTATLRLSFWSADWTPWPALAVAAARWPALRFAVAPTYGPL
jgi:hypothetical protein